MSKSLGMCCIRSLQSADYLNKLHNRYWVHEVHANNLMSAFRNAPSNLRNWNAGSVSSQDGIIFGHLRDIQEDALFKLKVFIDCFNNQITTRKCTDIRRPLQSTNDTAHISLSKPFFIEFFFTPVCNKVFWFLQVASLRVNIDNLIVGNSGGDDTNSGTHLTSAKYSNSGYIGRELSR